LTTSRKKLTGAISGSASKEATNRPGAVNGGGLNQRTRDRLQRGEEEQEVVAYLLPYRGEDHQEHRLAAVLRVVPVVAQLAEEMGDQPAPGVKRKIHSTAATAGHGVRQQHQRLIKAAAAHHIVDQRGKKQRNEQAADGHQVLNFMVVQNESR
jgi:hypothetical protein